MVELPEVEMEQTEEEEKSKYKQMPEDEVSIEIEGLPSEETDNEKQSAAPPSAAPRIVAKKK